MQMQMSIILLQSTSIVENGHDLLDEIQKTEHSGEPIWEKWENHTSFETTLLRTENNFTCDALPG